jgi:predicted Zn-dependent peptidase
LISDPYLENGVFKRDYVRQEKEQQAKEIRGLVNDKVSYAMERCVQEMCPNERFGVFKYGSVDDLDSISEDGLYSYYQSLLRENPIDVFVVGEIDTDETFSLLEDAFSFSREDRSSKLPPVEVYNTPGGCALPGGGSSYQPG